MTLLEINKAIIDQLKPSLTGNYASVKFSAEDLNEPIIRPSIKVTIENPSIGRYTAANIERNLTVRLYYFAESDIKNKFDNMAMQSIIENTFIGGLEVGDEIIFIESIDSDITDGVLVSSFDLLIYEEIDEDVGSGEPLEVLDLTIN